MTLADDDARNRAIDPTQSYIVQAPAGSGKTEILTKRFLNLLCRVSSPEQIYAITFTRKAANEMRERIILALENAQNNIIPNSPHQQSTLDIAKIVLTRDKELNWGLLNQPNRLKIITIDSLCQTISNAIYLHENQSQYANIIDKPQKLYIEAAKNCIEYIAKTDGISHILEKILRHLDNRHEVLIELLSDLLAKRDQWLILLYQGMQQDKTTFEQAIKSLETSEITRFKQTISSDLSSELLSLVKQLYKLINFDTNESVTWDDINISNASILAKTLTTSQNTLRKSFDHHIGFKKGICSDTEYSYIKQCSKDLLEKLSNSADFLNSLTRIANLPDPQYNDNQWDILQALFTILPLLVAHLNIIFNENNLVDFIAISEQAHLALGSDDNPTNLALYLDNKIHHILVDEFQDTSIQQFNLLTQLVQGFEQNDGRTLFIVGDPMQSIYRFRAAEVGLFLKAKRYGIGPVKLIPLELVCNFRSTKTVVDWININFKAIFPKNDNIRSGAVSFAKSIAVKDSELDSYIKSFNFENRQHEAIELIKIIQYELKSSPNDNIAVLVKSRSQLRDLMQYIRNENIKFQGVDIDLLSNLAHLRDIYSILEALLFPGKRLAWLSLLRSPWCGINLYDLHCIANFNKSKSIYFALSRLDNIQGLSEEGFIRCSFIYTVLNHAILNKGQLSIVEWVINVINNLKVEYILTNKEQNDLEQFWCLIEQNEINGGIADWQIFKEQFNSLFANTTSTSKLQIMTIHKSKGLEFDTVIIPGLGAKSIDQDKAIFRWLNLPTESSKDLLLLSPIKASYEESCKLYNFLGQIDSEKSTYELQRLLYVALTRAKKRLYLSDYHANIVKSTFRDLLHKIDFLDVKQNNEINNNLSKEPKLYHLPFSIYQTPTNIKLTNNPTNSANKAVFDNGYARLLGIITHELLQMICTNHPKTIADINFYNYEKKLNAIGLNTKEIKNGITQITSQINTIFTDPIGAWIIKEHSKEKNEYELLVKNDNQIKTKIIDRTFIENNTRWIIDFKTGHYDLNNELHYKKQLNEYASYFIDEGLKIKCGIYYLQVNLWISWEYSESSQDLVPEI